MTASFRNSQESIEVLRSPDSPGLSITQVSIEILKEYVSEAAFRLSQESIEVLKDHVVPDFLLSQESIEVLKKGYEPDFRVSQESIEVLKSFEVQHINCSIDLPSGTYLTTVTIGIEADEPGASIFYTKDGSVPDKYSTPYTGRIPMFTGTLSAFAMIDGFADAPMVTADYVAKIPKPDIVPPSGIYTISENVVEITSSVAGATIYYTVDGTVPTVSSSIYTSAFPMFIGTVRAFAVANNYADSEVNLAIYYDGLTWPSTLPRPNRTISAQVGNNLSVKVWQKGRSEVRKFGANPYVKIKVQLRLQRKKIETFESWFNSISNFGTDWFSADWLPDMGFANHKARILGYPALKGKSNVYADYSLTLQVQRSDLVIDDLAKW